MDLNKIVGVIIIVVGVYYCYKVIKSASKEWDSYYFVKGFFAGIFAIILGIIILLKKTSLF